MKVYDGWEADLDADASSHTTVEQQDAVPNRSETQREDRNGGYCKCGPDSNDTVLNGLFHGRTMLSPAKVRNGS